MRRDLIFTMKIYFGTHKGKDMQELPSEYLLHLIEKHPLSDHSIKEAAKKELSYRINLDFEEKKDTREPYIKHLEGEVQRVTELNIILQKIMFIYGITHWDTDKYFFQPIMLDQDINESIEEGKIQLPIAFAVSNMHKEYMKRFREENNYTPLPIKIKSIKSILSELNKV